MIIYIDSTKTIADVQERFNKSFPFLTLNFYEKSHLRRSPEVSSLLDSKIKVADVASKKGYGTLQILSTFKIHQVEKDFKKLFGLNVKIFKREDDKWVSTEKEGAMTLKAQCETVRKVNVHCNNK